MPVHLRRLGRSVDRQDRVVRKRTARNDHAGELEHDGCGSRLGQLYLLLRELTSSSPRPKASLAAKAVCDSPQTQTLLKSVFER